MNSIRNKLTLKLLGAVCVSMVAGGAFAATSTTTFEVTATVADSCSVTATSLAFGSITPVDNANIDATSTVSVTCSNGTAYEIRLDDGVHSSDLTVATRRMSDGGLLSAEDFLSYQLYSDAGRSVIWGETTLVNVVTATGNGSLQGNTVYGRIPLGQQSAPTGLYSDTINVTVSF